MNVNPGTFPVQTGREQGHCTFDLWIFFYLPDFFSSLIGLKGRFGIEAVVFIRPWKYSGCYMNPAASVPRKAL